MFKECLIDIDFSLLVLTWFLSLRSVAQVPGLTPSLLWWWLGPAGSAASSPWAAGIIPEVSGHRLTGFQSQVLLRLRLHRSDHTFGHAVHPWLILVNGTAKLPSAQNKQLDTGCPLQVHPWWCPRRCPSATARWKQLPFEPTGQIVVKGQPSRGLCQPCGQPRPLGPWWYSPPGCPQHPQGEAFCVWGGCGSAAVSTAPSPPPSSLTSHTQTHGMFHKEKIWHVYREKFQEVLI